jgi:hypothetical protein
MGALWKHGTTTVISYIDIVRATMMVLAYQEVFEISLVFNTYSAPSSTSVPHSQSSNPFHPLGAVAQGSSAGTNGAEDRQHLGQHRPSFTPTGKRKDRAEL